MPERHSAQFVIHLKGNSGKVRLEISEATATDIVEWMTPVLAYLNDQAFVEQRVEGV